MSGSGRPVAINPEALGAPSGYSHGMLAPEGGRTLYVAGQIGVAVDGRDLDVPFVGQFATALRNVVAVVEEAGGTAEHVASMTIYIVDKDEYLNALSEVGRAYRSVMGRHFPAMALVEVSALVEPGARLEIQAIAVLP